MLSKPKRRSVAVALAIAGAVTPLSGLHKFYMGQPMWGVFYLVLAWTPIPRIASTIEAVWYLLQHPDEFDQNFNAGISSGGTTGSRSPASQVDPQHVSAIAEALRHLDQLRQDGLISEYEFEQKRRHLLDHMV